MAAREVTARRLIRRISARVLRHCWPDDLERAEGLANDFRKRALDAVFDRGFLIGPVDAISAQDPVVPVLPPQRITAVGPDQNIVAAAAGDEVIASAGVDAVVSIAAINCVVALAA